MIALRGHHISIHALREEGDRIQNATKGRKHHFYPRPPRGGRQSDTTHTYDKTKISIHALREEGDCSGSTSKTSWANFYPRPPRGGRPVLGLLDSRTPHFYPRPPRGGRLPLCAGCKTTEKFLSTPSARRATAGSYPAAFKRSNFYPRPPRGGRRRKLYHEALVMGHFYPRPPRGGRRDFVGEHSGAGQFLSTPSARRATDNWRKRTMGKFDFYPRPPRGGRLVSAVALSRFCKFLSTPSARRATWYAARMVPPPAISIHALREEGDKLWQRFGPTSQNFYPRPPRGGRPPEPQDSGRASTISIHALREEGDLWCPVWWHGRFDFYPRPPRGGRQQKQRQNLYFLINYTTFCTNLEEP